MHLLVDTKTIVTAIVIIIGFIILIKGMNH